MIREAQRLIAANLLDPPRSCVATWYGLLGEMQLVAGVDGRRRCAALDRADFYLECLRPALPRGPAPAAACAAAARARRAGSPSSRAAAEAARALSVDREARLFATRADEFLASLR